jgi:PAS domain S-box-containing protein
LKKSGLEPVQRGDAMLPRHILTQHGDLKISALYAVLGILWILFSDKILADFATDPQSSTHLQTFKGILYVVVTAGLLYALINISGKALRESERALSTLMSNLPGMAYRCRNDRSWTMEFVSTGCLELTGYESQDLVANRKVSYGDLIHSEHKDYIWNEVQSALQKKMPFKFIYRILTATGEEKWVWEQGRGIFSPKGELLFLEGIISDISEQKHAEDALRNSEEKHRALVESSSDAILLVDGGRRILSCNKAFLNLFGLEEHEAVGKSIRVVHPSEESFQSFAEKAYPAIDKDGFFRTEWTLMRKGGVTFPVEATLSAIRLSGGVIGGYVGIIRDITERKLVEEELRRRRDRLSELIEERTRELDEAYKSLMQKERLKTLGAISAQVAHEIRNPLMSIGGFARRLSRKLPESSEAEIIMRESERLEALLARIMNYLKPVEMIRSECQVNRIVFDCKALFPHDSSRESTGFELELDPALPPAYADSSVLYEVILTLIRNALRFTDHAGNLTIRTFENAANVCIQLCIHDPTHKLKTPESLFSPFDENGPAMVIPLSYRLMEDAGGKFSFAQEENRMALTLCLPPFPGMSEAGRV